MKPREIEQTNKKLKAHIICCYLLGIFGSIILFCSEPWQKKEAVITTFIFWFVALVWYFITRFRIWMRNG